MLRKYLYIVTSLDQGGLETYLLRFLQYDNHKHYNIVLCKSGISGALHEQFIKIADEVILFRLGFFSIKDYIRFFKLLRDKQIETVCDFTGNFAGVPLFISCLAQVKKRISFYRESSKQFKGTLLKNMYAWVDNKLVLFFANRILSNSKAAFKNFFPYINVDKHRKFKIIYNGIELSSLPQEDDCFTLRKEFGFKEADFIVGHTGRCIGAKNHDTMMHVATILCKKYKHVHFVFVGKGVTEKYGGYVRNQSLENRIHFLGYRRDALNLYQLFDVFYFPSLTEGQPNALIEAMVMGVPIVASDIPSIRETVPNSFYPFLLPPSNVDAAVISLEKILNKEVDIKSYTFKAWARKKFDAKIWFQEFQNEL